MGKYVNKAAEKRRKRTRYRTAALLVALLVAGALLDPAIIAPFGPLASRAERVEASFTLCGQGKPSFACVVDGDTFRLGDRRVRLIGIDAPELSKPQCAEERALAVKAAARLQELLNQGHLDLVAHRIHSVDRHGRDLRLVWSGEQSVGDTLMNEGLAHRYIGFKRRWC